MYLNKFKMNADNENFRNLFNVIHDFLFILDYNGVVVEVNNAVVEHLGYSKEEVCGSSMFAIHPIEYRDKAQQIVRRMIEGQNEVCPLPLLKKNGEHVPVETKIYKGKWNNVDALIGISRNLSDMAVSEEKFYRVFENNQALMSISDLETGTLINVNKKFLATLGYKRSEIIGRNSKELNMLYDYEKRAELAEKIKNNKFLDNEYIPIRTKDNRLIHCLFSISPIKIQTHSYILSSAIDISHLKDVERKLEKGLRHQRLLADISQNLLSLDDFDAKLNKTLAFVGEHTDVSRVYIFQDNEQETETSNTYEWCNVGVSPQIADLQNVPYELIPSWKPLLTSQGRIFSINICELPPDLVSILEPQEIKSVLVFPLIVTSKFFGFIGFDECKNNKLWDEEEVELLRTIAGIISNFFERRQFQTQLAESEIRQKLAIENTQAGLWDWNIQTGYVFFNDMWCSMLGYGCNEIEPNVKSWETLVHPDDMPKVLDDLNSHLEGKRPYYENVHRLLTKEGPWKWVIDKGKVIEYDSNGKPLRAIGTHIDIDNQKKVEEELRDLNATKDKLFSIIAHDLRGPIGSMMQIAELISDTDGLNEDTLFSFLHSQRELTQSTFQLLENLLSWARYNQHQITYSPKVIELAHIIDEAILNVKYAAKQKGISIVSDISQSFSAFADEDMVKLIIRNLLSNAIKFTASGGFIRVEVERNTNHLVVAITDTGIGISQENIDVILSHNQFYSTYGTNKEKGTGLGLKLCKSFIEQNKGELTIESVLGKGTSFKFTLPVV